MGRKKKNLSWSGEKKTYPHIEEGSLCHRPSNCNLSNLCGLYKSLVPEIVSWFLRFAESLAPPAIFLAPPAFVFGVNCLESSLWHRLWRRGKKYTWDLSYSEGRGEATLKRRVYFWSVTVTFPSKVQPAGGCFELQTLYWACRVFVLKSSKSQDILVKIGCFTQKCRFEQHPPLRTYTNSSLASCILVQLSDLCNLGFAVHVQYGITNTCWRHARLYWGVCRDVSQLPNSLIYRKSPPNCCLRAKEVRKIGNFMYFWTKKWLKIQGRSSFVRFAPSEVKNSTIFAKCPHYSENQDRSTFEKFAPSSDENPWYGLGWSQSNA